MCEHCGLVMSHGYTYFGDTVCSEACLAVAEGWVVDDLDGNEVRVTSKLIGQLLEREEKTKGREECSVFHTDWEGNEQDEDVLERLKTAPYNMTEDEIRRRLHPCNGWFDPVFGRINHHKNNCPIHATWNDRHTSYGNWRK